MPPRKRQNVDAAEPVAKRRSSRQAAVTAAQPVAGLLKDTKTGAKSPAKRDTKNDSPASGTFAKTVKPTPKRATAVPTSKSKAVKDSDSAETSVTKPRATSEDPEIDFIPTVNSEAPRHDGEWYWLMKAEPESRFENGIDVRFSIDDLRAKEKPEGWDGIRAYAARNHMRNMNAGDKAFFYHSNCKEPAIAGIMEIVKEFSEDKSARRAGTPYYDPASTKDKPRWSLVHVEFRKKFAVPITLKELRELGNSGGPLETMQMLKQSRLSVSRVSGDEWKSLCDIADKKAKEAGLKHEEGKTF